MARRAHRHRRARARAGGGVVVRWVCFCPPPRRSILAATLTSLRVRPPRFRRRRREFGAACVGLDLESPPARLADKRSPRDAKFIEIIGTYDPKKAGDNSHIDLARADYWLGCGAKPSDTVRTILKRARKSGLLAGDKAGAAVA